MNSTATPLPITLAIVRLPTYDDARMQKIVDTWGVYDTPLPVEADRRLTDPAKIAADLDKKRARAVAELAERNATNIASRKKEWHATASSPLLGGSIAIITFAVGDDGMEGFDVHESGSVRQMLEDFFTRMAEITHCNHRGILREGVLPPVERPVLVGHGIELTVRFIAQLSMAERVPVPVWWPVGVSPYDTHRVFDIEHAYAGHRGRASLRDLCAILKLPDPCTELDAASNAESYSPGDENRTLLLRSADVVRATRCVYRVIKGQKLLPDDINMLDGDFDIDGYDSDPAPDDPTDVPLPRDEIDYADALAGEPIDETDIEDDSTIDDAEAA